ncbi:Succinate dehydrogenase assembly factor 4, mitochondrial [Eumeta japonica]|uniref:Succinate dehydrogenase assembly factor 4, mitochondrial n=1 Tax=Eumeta variegata TaxID=151549 RepID=A0A4C1TG59_EUMVA|nr:Succinate dehydrogenase assembly factor 4, mitochondrial [Eumeta japonica]
MKSWTFFWKIFLLMARVCVVWSQMKNRMMVLGDTPPQLQPDIDDVFTSEDDVPLSNLASSSVGTPTFVEPKWKKNYRMEEQRITINLRQRLIHVNTVKFSKDIINDNPDDEKKQISPRIAEFRKKLRETTPIDDLGEQDDSLQKDDALPPWPDNTNPHTGEIGGPRGPEPTRYGDWERKGRVTDF